MSGKASAVMTISAYRDSGYELVVSQMKPKTRGPETPQMTVALGLIPWFEPK